MSHNDLLNWVFALQILLVSALIPFWIKKHINRMMTNHPIASFPKLYPVGQARIHAVLHVFYSLNAIAVILGVLILAHKMNYQTEELLNWDTQAILTVYFLIQCLPFIFLGASDIKYQKLMRLASTASKRKAMLQPRKLTDFVTIPALCVVLLTLLIYTTVVFIAQNNPFPGFAGYWNILYVILLNVFYLVMIYIQINGKKHNPHQTHEDRIQQISVVVNLLVFASIAGSLFLTSSLILSMLELREWGDVVQSVYFCIVALMASQINRQTPKDFSVYRSDNDPNQTQSIS